MNGKRVKLRVERLNYIFERLTYISASERSRNRLRYSFLMIYIFEIIKKYQFFMILQPSEVLRVENFSNRRLQCHPGMMSKSFVFTKENQGFF